MINTISKIKRIDDAKNARSDAINRFMSQCEQEAKDAQGELLFYKGFGVFLILIGLTAILGIK